VSVSRLNASRVSESQALAETLVVVATTATALPRHPLQEQADVRVAVDTMLRSAICHLATASVLVMVMMRVCVLDRAYTVGETPRSTAGEIGVGETAVHHAVGGTTTVRATILLVVVRNLTR